MGPFLWPFLVVVAFVFSSLRRPPRARVINQRVGQEGVDGTLLIALVRLSGSRRAVVPVDSTEGSGLE